MVMKQPSRRFTPRAIANIRHDMSNFQAASFQSVDSLYEAIVGVFLSRSSAKPVVPSNEAESWTNLIPAALR